MFIYLLMVVPCTWTLEMSLLGDRLKISNSSNISDCAASEDIHSDAIELADVQVKGVNVSYAQPSSVYTRFLIAGIKGNCNRDTKYH